MALQAVTQLNVTSNKDRNLIFFPGGVSAADDSVICYNYKTQQWTACPAYDGIGTYSIVDKDNDIGLIRFSSGSVDLQDQTVSGGVKQTATIETGAASVNPGGRAVIDAVRPLVNGGTTTVRIGVQDSIGGAVTYSTGTALTSRTSMSHFRGAANTAEGRYHRLELTVTDFTTIMGAEIDFTPSGKV